MTFKDGAATLGTVTLNSSGVATYTINPLDAASHTYTAEYSGETDRYNAASTTISYEAGKIDQATLTITGPGSKTYGDAAFSLSTSGGSGGGAVTYSVPAGNTVLTVTSGGAVTITGAGTVTVTVAKAGDATYNEATATMSTTVQRRDIANVTVTVLGGPHDYTGSQLQPVFDVSDGGIAITSGDYTNTYGANVNAGINDGSVTLAGQGNYFGTTTVNFDIEPLSLTGEAITLAGTSFTYTGAQITPAVTSVVVGGITVPVSEYDVSYANNVSAGTATVTVTAKAGGNCIDSASTKFTITRSYSNSNNNNSGSSDNGGSSVTITDVLVPLTSAPAITWLEPNPAQTLTNAAKTAKQSYARTRSTSIYGVRAAAWAKFTGLKYEHDTMDGGAVQMRLYINNPEKLAKDTLVSGYVKGSDADWARAHFEKWFKNKLRVIHFDQQADWGQTVKVAAKVDLTGIDTKNLYFYSYDKATNSYRRIEKPAYWIDTNGYIRFTTEFAGDIIISEGPLGRR